MIEFNSVNGFKLENEAEVSNWISSIISEEGFEEGEISYVFCSDEYLLQINVEFLNHDTLTDIISFDYSLGKQMNGEIYISIERVLENAKDFETSFINELHRVMIHGILHYCGYKDKTEEHKLLMRKKEETSLSQRIFL